MAPPMDITVLNNLWKINFDGKVHAAFRVLTPMWGRLRRLERFRRISPREYRFTVDLRGGIGGTANTSDGGSTAREMSNEPVEGTLTWNHLTRRIGVSYDVFNAQDDPQFRDAAIKEQVAWQVAEMLKSFAVKINIEWYGKSDAVLAKVSSVAGQVITLKDRYGRSGVTPDASWFQANSAAGRSDWIAAHDGSAPATVRGWRKVTARDLTNKTITYGGAAISGLAANDLIVLGNHLDGATSDYNKAMTGFGSLIGDDVVHGIDRTVAGQEKWYRTADAAINGRIPGTRLFKDLQHMEKESGYKVTDVVSTIEAIAEAGAPETANRRYDPSDQTMVLGHEGIKIPGGKRVEADLFCPPGELYAWAEDALRQFSPDTDPETVKTGGPQQFVYGGTYLGYYLDKVFRYELACLCRLATMRYTGLTES